MGDASGKPGVFSSSFWQQKTFSKISVRFPSHELYVLHVWCSKVMINLNFTFFVYSQEWAALENLMVGGISSISI